MRVKPHRIGLLLPLLAVAACAHPASPVGGSTTPSPSPSPSPTWMIGVGVIGVTGITINANGRLLSITVKVPAADDATLCYRHVSTRVSDFSQRSAIIGVSMDVWTGRECSIEATIIVKVRLPKPLGTRTVNVNNSSDGGYVADPEHPGALRFCYEFRCAPDPATCEPATIAAVARGADMQQPVTWIVRGCDEHWLVLDLSFTGGPACDNSCSPTSGTALRWYYRATPQGWTEIVGTRSGGCAAVQAVDASFPTAICENLEPLS